MVDNFYTAQEVASCLKVHKTTIYKWVKEGRLQAYKITYGVLRIAKDDLDDFVANRLKGAPNDRVTVRGMPRNCSLASLPPGDEGQPGIAQ